MQKIEVVVTPQGETTVTTVGFKGKSCQDATKQLEQALGIVQSEQKLPSFYQTEGASQQARQ
ncbi:DUF2997 domain-containing protein [Nitrospira sp. BLG_2]|uniref:DUF2997 domain-containing protein n=1 Tax=Nitrospira sp. BLG_2 TaxID=3397507 RepID=UPI003B99C2C8